MKDRIGLIVRQDQEEYLERLLPKRDRLLVEMERYAEQHGVPIADPEVATFLEIAVRAVQANRVLEVGTAIRYSARARESDGAAALDLLRDLSIEIHALTWDLLRKANAISWAYKIAMYDAAYVALAEGVGFPLLTADEGLLKKMKGHSIVLRLRDLTVGERR